MRRPNPNDKGQDSEKFRKLFIGGLDYRTTDETLKNFFSQWGEIVDVVVMKHPATQKSRGFGFVTYSDLEMVDKAMENRPHKIDGREVDSKRAVPRDAQESGHPDANQNVKKMFVGGLKDQPEEDLSEYFGKFGKILNVNIVTDHDGKRKGFCFVEFDDYDPVDKCVLFRNHSVCGKSLSVKKAIPKDSMSGKGGMGGGGSRGIRGDAGGGNVRGSGVRSGKGGGGGWSGGQQADVWGGGGGSQSWASQAAGGGQYGGGGGYSSWDQGGQGGGWGPSGNNSWNDRSSYSKGGWGGQGGGGGYPQQGGGGGGYGGGAGGGGPIRSNYLSQSRATPYSGGGGGGGGYGGGGRGGGGSWAGTGARY